MHLEPHRPQDIWRFALALIGLLVALAILSLLAPILFGCLGLLALPLLAVAGGYHASRFATRFDPTPGADRETRKRRRKGLRRSSNLLISGTVCIPMFVAFGEDLWPPDSADTAGILSMIGMLAFFSFALANLGWND